MSCLSSGSRLTGSSEYLRLIAAYRCQNRKDGVPSKLISIINESGGAKIPYVSESL